MGVPTPRDQVALARAFGRVVQDEPHSTPAVVAVGDIASFWVLDPPSGTFVQVVARLRYAGPVALFFVDTQVEVAQDVLERSARDFEQRIVPRTRTLFGQEDMPGVDGDPRLTVLNTGLQGVGGYFSAADLAPRDANRFSNQRDMFVIGVNSFPIGAPSYAATLAHELQHMIAWHRNRRGPAWFGEGLSTLAEDLNGHVAHGSAAAFLADPDLQLTTWSAGAEHGRHYGASRLFMRYVHEHYAGDAGLLELLERDAGNATEVFAAVAARRRPDVGSFHELFADWTVANLLNDPAAGDGRFAYRLLPGTVTPMPATPGESAGEVRQFGADYLDLGVGPLTLSFDGADVVPLVGTSPASGRFAWWSGRGDESVSTLTRALDLRGVTRATLALRLWHELERHYDYAFVSVSSDGGVTWTPLAGRTTTEADPQGMNFGSGLTGVSGAPEADLGTARGVWVDEQFDLTPYAGRRVLLRVWVVSDTAVNGPGLLLDDLRVPEIGLSDDVEVGTGGWEAQGFARVSGELPQRWSLRLVRRTDVGVVVEPVALDDAGRATVRLAAGERAVLVVSGVTEGTTEPAMYEYRVER
jgi:hypothetical protein